MKLTLEQIKAICLGVVRAVDTENGVRLYRFTEEQEKAYRQKSLSNIILTTAGVKLYFETNSSHLFLKVNVTSVCLRKFFSFDVTVDGKMIGSLNNFSDVELPQNYTQCHLPEGEFSKVFTLGEGNKKVCIYLPWSMMVEIRELSLEDGAWLKPIKYSKKLLAFGDSITQGFDALYSSGRYVARLAEALDAEEINKGISGEGFFPKLAEICDEFEPDYITVAYGTNDWCGSEEHDFYNRCYACFSALCSNYPNAKIFAITPIWRKDYMEEKAFGEFGKVADDIEKIVKGFENITYINGFKLIPQDENYFADLRLHPNDRGFDCYFHNLYKKIIEAMEGMS